MNRERGERKRKITELGVADDTSIFGESRMDQYFFLHSKGKCSQRKFYCGPETFFDVFHVWTEEITKELQ